MSPPMTIERNEFDLARLRLDQRYKAILANDLFADIQIEMMNRIARAEQEIATLDEPNDILRAQGTLRAYHETLNILESVYHAKGAEIETLRQIGKRNSNDSGLYADTFGGHFVAENDAPSPPDSLRVGGSDSHLHKQSRKTSEGQQGRDYRSVGPGFNFGPV